jgi:hypothetical protein
MCLQNQANYGQTRINCEIIFTFVNTWNGQLLDDKTAANPTNVKFGALLSVTHSNPQNNTVYIAYYSST